MTIKIFSRPRFHFSLGEDWTEIRIEGDSEEPLASIIVSQLLATRHEVKQLDDDADEPVAYGDYHG